MNEEKNTENTQTQYTSTGFNTLSAKERYDFARFLALRGASFRTALDRIMYRGFESWERVGIRAIMREFGVPSHQLTMATVTFFVSLNTENRVKLFTRLEQMGMCRNTAKRRFEACSFHEWELTGVDALFDEWSANHQEP